MIATAKVKAVEASIDLCWRLKQEVGSYALMGDSGFGTLDFLQCCKFAEGDSRVLMLKMSRDRLRRFAKDVKAAGGGRAAVPAGQEAEVAICASLGKSLAAAKGDKAAEAAVFDDKWEEVYALAEAIMARTTAQAMQK
jgi:acyl-CoA oxidase